MKMLFLALFYSSLTFATPFPPKEPVQFTCNIAYYVQNGPVKHSKPVALYLAYLINKEALERDLDPLKVASIIAVETDFRFIRVNNTGDYGLTQINYRTWSREFKRLKVKALDKERLIKDTQYSIKTMTQILEITRNRWPNDPVWYARYHSSTPKLKKAYAKKVKSRLQKLKKYANMSLTKCANQGDFNGTTNVSITE